MQLLEVSCAVRRFFKSLGFKGLRKLEQISYTLNLRGKAVWGVTPYNLVVTQQIINLHSKHLCPSTKIHGVTYHTTVSSLSPPRPNSMHSRF